MVRAWIMDESDADKRLPHMTEPPQMVDLDYLKELGILYYKLDADNWKEEGKLDEIRKERNYNYEDEVEATRETLPSYDATLEMWYEEHIHSDEEIRFILDGSGYFDVRNRNDKWIRIETEKGDMLILPAGIYHRFTMDTKDFIKAKRLFSGVPVWTAHKRPQEEHESRRNYVKNYSPM
ncbi:acireductone dioxygenase-like [Saccoglossus kowalevskii]|uniref:Acireductone dioxygenase n=1 Tax=Saccoglossus kowalevskii TaxID=10224 RepID=A0ABM0GWM9_SACKO|nr:PREDICTED: 1,2-dihydroxy-3-keto-5-methylthiopentene dioxygenase-like [Saccoglossus kowalevskii]